jgi:uncharacterized tellurite resistance protein B-like protein
MALGPTLSQVPAQSAGANVFQSFAVEKPAPFDVTKLADKFKHRNTGWSIPEAFLCLLFSAAMADGTFAGPESDAIKVIVGRSRAMTALTPQALAAANDVVNQRMQQNPNSLEEACQTLPADMCLPVFAHCVDIILSDGQLIKSEAEWLNQIALMLDIEPDNARRVMEVLLLKAQY